MNTGEKCILRCRSDYAYGERGQGSIPADASLDFEVELLEWTEWNRVKSDDDLLRKYMAECSKCSSRRSPNGPNGPSARHA